MLIAKSPMYGNWLGRNGSFTGQPISYATALKRFKRLLALVGANVQCFGTHSLRRGAATTASESGGNIFDIMSLGRWRRVESAFGYVDSSVEQQLQISRLVSKSLLSS